MRPIHIPRAQSPESAGISSKALAEMMRDVLDHQCEVHSIMVLRHGRAAYEDFRDPYGPDNPHALYSVSKSITSIAVGFAVEEGLLRLEDKAADLLPELREYDTHENLEKLQVVHLVSMCAGKNISVMADRTKKLWVKDFALGKWDYAPGEGWHYCNENIYILCAILQRVCGESVVDYLMPRLFEPLGIARPFWETDGRGVESGGWGLYLKTEDLAKIGLCYLDDGMFQGRRVIPARWVRASGSKQRDTSKNGGDDNTDQGQQGYGYAFWMNTPPGGFRMDGMFSQYVLMFPAYDACVVTTGGELDMGKLYRALFRHIPAIFSEDSDQETGTGMTGIPKLPAYPPLHAPQRNQQLEAMLNRRCIRFLPILQPAGKALGLPLSMMPAMIFFMSADKGGGIDRVHFRFGADGVTFSWSEGRERNTVLCGMDGRWRRCRITLGGVAFVLACSAAWEGSRLHIRLRNLNSVAERRLAFEFRDRAVRMLPSSDPGLEHMVTGALDAAKASMPNKVLGDLVGGAMGRFALLLLAEPPHYGYMR